MQNVRVLRRKRTWTGCLKDYLLKLTWLTWVFLLLNLADCILTQVLINNGHTELMPQWSILSFWWKVPLSLLAGILLQSHKRAMVILCLGMGVIVIWNSLVLVAL